MIYQSSVRIINGQVLWISTLRIVFIFISNYCTWCTMHENCMSLSHYNPVALSLCVCYFYFWLSANVDSFGCCVLFTAIQFTRCLARYIARKKERHTLYKRRFVFVHTIEPFINDDRMYFICSNRIVTFASRWRHE